MARSVWPLVRGWYPVDKLTVAPSAQQKTFHTPEVNWGPRSDTMSQGMPCRRKTCCTRSWAVSVGWRKASDEIQGNVRPGARRNGERSEQASGRAMRRLSMGAGRAGCHKLLKVPIHGGTPEVSSEEGERLSTSRVARPSGGMTPLEDLRSNRARDKCAAWWTITWVGFGLEGVLDPSLNLTTATTRVGRMNSTRVSGGASEEFSRDRALGFWFRDPGL